MINFTTLTNRRTFDSLQISLLIISVAILSVSVFANYPNVSLSIQKIAVWWMLILAVSVLITALTVRTTWRVSGFLSASLLVGSASQLAMTEPHWFQPFILKDLTPFLIVMVFVIGVQAVATGLVLLNKQTIATGVAFIKALGVVKVVLWSAIIGMFSITIMKHVQDVIDGTIVRQFVVGVSFLALNMATALAVAVKLPSVELSQLSTHIHERLSFPCDPSEERKFDGILPYIAALFTLISALLLSFLAFQNIPHVEDELAHMFQAQYFALGKLNLVAPAPEIAAALEYYLIPVYDGKWYSMMFPGWPMVLSLGYVVGMPWLVGPLLAALSVLVAHTFTSRTSDRGTANVVAVLIAISPWFIASSASYMQHTVTVATALGAWVLVTISQERKSVVFALIGGCLMGYLFLTRPVEALILGTLTGLWLLPTLRARKGWLMVGGYGLGCILVGSFVFYYNYVLIGEPFMTPLNHYLEGLWGEGANRFGFGSDIGSVPKWRSLDAFSGHSFWEALVNIQHSGFMLSTDLFGWSIGSLGFLIFHMIWGKKSRFDIYMMIIAILVVGVYAFYWFVSGFYIGPRYWFGAFIPFVFLSVRGIISFASAISDKLPDRLAVQRFVCVMTVLTLFSTVSFLTWRAGFKYYEFRDFHTGYRELVHKQDLDGALLFLNSEFEFEQGSAFVLNSPTFDESHPLFVLDLGSKSNLAVAEAFPDRPIYFLQADIERKPRIKITKGPLSLADLKVAEKDQSE